VRCHRWHVRKAKKSKSPSIFRGREWQGKYFTNLNAWKVEKSVQNNVAQISGGSIMQHLLTPPVFEENTDFGGSGGLPADFDDLPF
jgi:hypothetical protein